MLDGIMKTKFNNATDNFENTPVGKVLHLSTHAAMFEKTVFLDLL